MKIKNLLSVFFFIIFQTLNAQSLYVDASRGSSGVGTSWGTAYKTVSEALNTAWQDATVTTVYVAKGSYAPTNYPYILGANKLGTAVTSGVAGYTLTNFDKTFHIRTGLEVYGGYPSGGGTTRDVVANQTILNASSNAYHVVLIDSSANWATTSDTTILDGFTITNGYATNNLTYTLNGGNIKSYNGGGLYLSGGMCKLQNNTITSNSCSNSSNTYIGGGGVYSATSTIFNDNIINSNSCSNSSGAAGGGVYCTNTTWFTNNIITYNTTSVTGQGNATGAGIFFLLSGSACNVTNCIIANNTANHTVNFGNSAGGGMHCYGGIVTVTNTVVVNNSSTGFAGTCAGGGIYTNTGTYTFNNCTIYGNTSTSSSNGASFGGGISGLGYVNQGVYNTINNLNNCIFWGNKSINTGTGFAGRPDIDNQQVKMNVRNTSVQLAASSYTDAGANKLTLASPDKNLYATRPLFVDSTNIAGADGVFGTTDDGLELTNISPLINAGSNLLVPVNVFTDFANIPRIQFSTVDIGAYESSNATVLPLTLLSFTANRQGNNNALNWTTSNEVGTKNFVVESSGNGSSFAPIGNVLATGSGNYNYLDINPKTNRTYYRLKMVDADSKFTYSNIVWVNSLANASISLYPNPVTQSTTLDIGNNIRLIGTKAQLTDAHGRLLQQIIINHNQQQIDMATLPAGLYLLKLNDGTAVKMMRL